jgi:hypothetical protein
MGPRTRDSVRNSARLHLDAELHADAGSFVMDRTAVASADNTPTTRWATRAVVGIVDPAPRSCQSLSITFSKPAGVIR